jgi:hypothetical protein
MIRSITFLTRSLGVFWFIPFPDNDKGEKPRLASTASRGVGLFSTRLLCAFGSTSRNDGRYSERHFERGEKLQTSVRHFNAGMVAV